MDGHATAEPPTWRVLGNLAGTARVQKSGDLVTGGLDATLTNLVATSASGTRVCAPEIRLVADGKYDCQSGLVALDAARLSTDGLTCAAAGRIDTGAQQTNLQLAGGLDYDLARLAGLWQPLLGNTVRLDGKGSQPLAYRGPLDPAAAEGEAGLGWASINAYGFRGGPAALRASLSRGVLQVQPLEMELNEGRLNLASAVRLAPGPLELYVQKGSAARQIRIDPAHVRQRPEVHRPGAGRRGRGRGPVLDRAGRLPHSPGRSGQGRAEGPLRRPLGRGGARAAGRASWRSFWAGRPRPSSPRNRSFPSKWSMAGSTIKD